MNEALLKKFKERYKSLNLGQREAVDSIDGPVMVIAGPGTGKTTILTLRVANILLKTDTPADAVLALTFTESGVKAIRKKLSEIIGPQAYKVRIHTFHSFANDIIKTYPDKFPRIIGSEHVEDLEQIALVENIINKGDKDGDFELLRPKGDPSHYVSKIISAIKDLKRENVYPQKLSEFLDDEEKEIMNAPDLKHEKGQYKGRVKGVYQKRLDSLAKNRELAKVYALYEKALEKERVYDFEDMIIEVVKRLEADENFRLMIQEEHQYILADEHQDANAAQNKLIELVSSFHENPNLFIVGDEKQAIFRFQGASLENFLYFKRRFPKAKLVKLRENYRSHQVILDASHALIGNNPVFDEGLRVRLEAKSDGAKQNERLIDCVSLPDTLSEIHFTASRIKKLIDSGVPASDIAVLIRNNKHAEGAERVLKSHGISVSRLADSDVLDHPYAESLISLLRAVIDPSNDTVLAKALFAPFLSLDIPSISSALGRMRKEKIPLIEVIRNDEAFKAFSEKFFHFSRLAVSHPAVESFETIAKESGFLDFIIGHERSRELVPLYSAMLSTVIRFAERERAACLRDFMERLDRAKERGYSISASYFPSEGVKLMTAHGSKGLEFDYVFIIHAVLGVWGGNRLSGGFKLPLMGRLEDEEKDEDERRLFYVAITRAKKHVTITYAEKNEEGKELTPSVFISEIPKIHVAEEKAEAGDIISKFSTEKPLSIFKDKEYLRTLFLERGFSVTHLNNFLKCPWQYFFVNLLLVPKAKENAELYGSAIHAALHDYFEAYKREEDMTIMEAVKLFESYIRRTHMTERDLKSHIKSGREEIEKYLSGYDFPRSIWNEYKIPAVPLVFKDLSGKEVEISLNGNLDKVELLGSGKAVNVVDYKTGRPKTLNELLGKNENSDGNYKRQLTFYKLLIDKYKAGEWVMETGTIDFIKPDKGGKMHREVFVITEEETSDLEKLISDTAKSILSFDFKGCDKPDCEWCALEKRLRF